MLRRDVRSSFHRNAHKKTQLNSKPIMAMIGEMAEL